MKLHVLQTLLTWSSFEQMFCLVSSHLRHGSEDVGTVDSRSLHAVAVVDLTVTSLLVHFKLEGRGEWEREEEIEKVVERGGIDKGGGGGGERGDRERRWGGGKRER